jgi:ferredoxin-NADP reductase
MLRGMLSGPVLQQLRRDVRSLVQGLVGDPPAPFRVRTRESAGLSGRSVVVREVRQETADAVSLVLVDPTGAPFEFVAGQFFTIFRRVNGRVLKRAYSASSPSSHTAALRITIKRVTGGIVSNDIADRIRVGDKLEVRGPSGSFVVPAGARRLVLVGGGSGITPLVSIARTFLETTDAATRVDLVYGSRSYADIVLREDLEALARDHERRFNARHVLETLDASVVHTDGTGRIGSIVSSVGRLDRDTVRRELEALEALDERGAHYFLCGPLGMMDETRAALTAGGIDRSRILEERFASPGSQEPIDASARAQALEVVTPTTTRTVVVRPGQTLLEGATAAGVELPFSCTLGGCGACKVKLARGTVTLPEPHCLSDAELADGYVLTCIARPRSACTLEVSP